MLTGINIPRIYRGIWLLILVSGIPVVTNAQIHLKQAGITVSLPNKEWKIYEEKETENNYICIFKRSAMTDSLGNQITPNIAIVSEPLEPGVDVIAYSIKLRNKTSYKVTRSLNMKGSPLNVIGYQGTYGDRKGLFHTVYILYIVKDNTGIQIILDTTTDLFPHCDKEFQKFIKSIN